MSNSTENHTVQLVAFADNPDPNAEPFPVVATFPNHIDPVTALAALVEAAAVDEGVEYEELLEKIAALRPDKWGEWQPSLSVGGRPPKIRWREKYGKSAASLEKNAQRAHDRRVALKKAESADGVKESPSLSKAACRRAELVKARARAWKINRTDRAGAGGRMRTLPDETIKKDAEALRQTVRGKPPQN